MRSGKVKTQAVVKGIHVSETPQSRMMNPPTDFARPAEKMKLTESPAPSTSVKRRPSRYPNTIPQTNPSGKPLVNKKMILHGAGIRPNSSQDKPATDTVIRIPVA